jgi:hypothetical protein
MGMALAKRLEYLDDSEASGANTMKACCNDKTIEKFLEV